MKQLHHNPQALMPQHCEGLPCGAAHKLQRRASFGPEVPQVCASILTPGPEISRYRPEVRSLKFELTACHIFEDKLLLILHGLRDYACTCKCKVILLKV